MRDVYGYKVGYELTAEIYYDYVAEFTRTIGVGPSRGGSWSSSIVSPAIADTKSSAHTRNEFRSMLLMNSRACFDVTGFNHKSGEAQLRTILEILEKVSADPPIGA